MQTISKIIHNIWKWCRYIRFNFWDVIIAGTIIFLLFVLFDLLYNPNFNYSPNVKQMKVNNVNKVCIDNFCREFNKPSDVYFFMKKIGKDYILQIKRQK